MDWNTLSQLSCAFLCLLLQLFVLLRNYRSKFSSAKKKTRPWNAARSTTSSCSFSGAAEVSGAALAAGLQCAAAGSAWRLCWPCSERSHRCAAVPGLAARLSPHLCDTDSAPKAGTRESPPAAAIFLSFFAQMFKWMGQEYMEKE